MITFSKKKIQNALFLGPFDTNTSKNEISAKRITSILWCQINVSSWKNSDKNN